MSAADDLLDELFAYFSPEDACKRFVWHLRRWQQDMIDRRHVYRQAVEQALPTLSAENAELTRRIWSGYEQSMDATTDAEQAEIDAWLAPLVEQPTPPGKCYLDVLEPLYFTPEINAECSELVRVAGARFEQLVMELIERESVA